MTSVRVFAFDVYGTLFDVHSVTRTCENHFPGYGNVISQLWRQKQIEYTFLRQAMGKYRPFSQVTKDALRFAAASYEQLLTTAAEKQLMDSYTSLQLYPESEQVLRTLHEKGHTLMVFSNGSRDMLEPLLLQADIKKYFDYILSVDDVKQYKPAPASYHLILDHQVKQRDQINFVSSNGWDISGAKAFGFTTAWINRVNQPEEMLQLTPDYTYTSLSPLTDV